MKIIIVGTAYPYRGGLAAFNERMAQEFVKEGHEVSVCTFRVQYPDFLFPGRTQFCTTDDKSGLHIKRMIHSCLPHNWRQVGKALKSEQPDLIIFCYWMSFMAPCMGTIARCAKRPSTKMIAVVHNMIPHERTLLDKWLPPYFVNSMDGFVSLSKSVVADIESFDKHHKPKRFSPHPIYDHYGQRIDKQLAKQQLGLDPSLRYVLFFGFIRKYKGLDLLLEAFADERLQASDVRLLVAGEFYDDPQPYLDQIESLGLTDKVVLKNDYIGDDEVAKYFSACDLVAQPYRSATQSGVTQVAFHFEKPMLVTNVGGLAEIVPHQKIGYVVEPNSQEIASALVDYFEHNREVVFSQNIQTEKQKYAWSNMTQTILTL